MERCVNSFLRSWLWVTPNFTSIGLYSRTPKFQLPLSSIIKEYKISKCRPVMTLRDSKDAKANEARVQTRTGRKWSASQAVQQAEDMLTIRDIIGNIFVGHQWIESSKFRQWKSPVAKISTTWCKRKYVEMRENWEMLRQKSWVSKGIGLGGMFLIKGLPGASYGEWSPYRHPSYRDLYTMSCHLLRICWSGAFFQETPDCQLCGARGTLAHILPGCKLALQQGRYRWRHDQVLRTLADILER